MKPKTQKERQEELVEEALGIEESGGVLEEILEEVEELTENLTEELAGNLTDAGESVTIKAQKGILPIDGQPRKLVTKTVTAFLG